jgi:hypothetical protein
MLQGTAATMAEMRARRSGAPLPALRPFDNPAPASHAAAGAKSHANAVTRQGEGQKDRLALVFRDAFSLRTKPLNQKLDDLVSVSPNPVARPRHHCFLIFLRGRTREQLAAIAI